MKKILSVLAIVLVTIAVTLFMVFEFLPKTYWSPSWQYGMREQKKHQITEKFINFSTDELILEIDSNKDWRQYKGGKGDLKSIKYEVSMTLLGSRTDEKALAKLKEIIMTFPEGQKWAVISSIKKSKNKAMIPVLCEALSKHTLNHTDDLIVKALVELDDPSALSCLTQEKDKLSYRTSRELAEKAIEKWNKENSNL
jgi:hypothetical protein